MSTNLGVHDKGTEGVFVQTNNDVIKYSNWNLWEPNDYWKSEDCIEMRSDGVWNDEACSKQKGYICEKTKGTKINAF